MSATKEFVLWFSGSPGGACVAFAAAACAHLARRGLRVELLTVGEAEGQVAVEDDERERETLYRFCREQLQEGVIPVIAEERFNRRERERLQQKLPTTLNLLITSSLEQFPSTEPSDGLVKPETAESATASCTATGFEEPLSPDIIFQASAGTPDEALSRLLSVLESRSLVPRLDSEIQRDEQMLIQRLKDLGYL
jgi:adenylylsulfate kinase-like enzyme